MQGGGSDERLPVVRHKKVDIIRLCGICQSFANYVFEFHGGICDQGVEIHPPNPIVLFRLYESLNHIEFQPCSATLSVGLVVHEQVVSVPLDVVYGASLEPKYCIIPE